MASTIIIRMAAASSFVQRSGSQLLLDGQPYRIVGGNTYYLGYVIEPTLNAALDLAQSFGMNSIRIWAFLDSAQPPGEWDVSFQYWDAAKAAPVANEGPNGLQRLDRAVASARERGIRLILTLTNNWPDFGGMPQYVQWLGLDAKHKNSFYSDPRCKEMYKNWVRQIVTRYRNEPAILAWELANEPRCEGHGGSDTLLAWADEMSAFVRQLDPNHLIGVGDEGYFKRHQAWGNPLYNGQYGVSCEDLLGLSAIDFGTMHMYPQSMAKDQDPVEFGLMWIREHLEAGQRANKPMLVEEYGLMAPYPDRNAVFAQWLASIEDLAGVGDMLWMMGLPKGPDQWYAPDAYVIESATDAPAIADHAAKMTRDKLAIST